MRLKPYRRDWTNPSLLTRMRRKRVLKKHTKQIRAYNAIKDDFWDEIDSFPVDPY